MTGAVWTSTNQQFGLAVLLQAQAFTPQAMTVTATIPTATGFLGGINLQILAVTGGTAGGGNGHQSTVASAASFALTPAQTKSLLAWAVADTTAGITYTAAASNTIKSQNTTAGAGFGTYTGTVTSGTPVTCGASNTGTVYNNAGWEITPSVGGVSPLIDASTPALVSVTGATTLTAATASFTPPAGAVLVAMCTANNYSSGTGLAPVITDSTGLTWTVRETQGGTTSLLPMVIATAVIPSGGLAYRATPAVQASGATVTNQTGTVAGDLILIFAVDSGDSNKQITCPGFTAQSYAQNTDTVTVLSRPADGTEAATFTLATTGTAGNLRSIIATISGGAFFDNASALEQIASSASVPVPGVTVNAAGSWAIWFARCAVGGGLTVPAGYTSRLNTGFYTVADNQAVAAGATGTVTGTAASNTNVQGALVSVAPNPVPAPPPAVAAFPAPVVAGAATVTAAIRAATTTFPAATVTGNAVTITPATVTATTTFPTAAASAAAAVAPATVTATAGQPAASAGGLLYTSTSEGGTSGTAVTPANSATGGTPFGAVTIGSGATFAFDNTQAAHGALAYKLATVAAATTFAQWTAPGAMPPQVWFRMYMYFTAYPAGGAPRLLTFLQGGTRCAYVQIASTGKIGIVNSGAATMAQTTAAVPLNAWFRVEGYLLGSVAAGQAELKLFPVADGLLQSETATSAANQLTAGVANTFNVGVSTAVASVGPYWMDDLGLSTSGYMGPTQPVMNPLVVAAAAGFPQPSITGTVAPATVAAAVTVPVPAVNLVTPAAVTAVQVIPYPAVTSTTAAATAAPAVAAATAVVRVPVVEQDQAVTVVAATGLAVFPAATVTGAATATPATVTTAATVPAPAVIVGLGTVAAAIVTATATVPAPVVRQDQTVLAATLTATTTVLAPAVRQDQNLAPATVTATATVLTATANIPAQITAATATATATARTAWVEAGRVGVLLNGPATGAGADFNAASTLWRTWTGVTIPVARYYLPTSTFAYQTDMQQMVAAGVKICLTLRPAYNPVNATDLANMATLLQTLRTAGAIVDVTLWHEPYFEGLTAAQYIAMVQYYGPTVRQYFPLAFVGNASSIAAHAENTYYPGDAWIDKIATDIYNYNYTVQGFRLDQAASIADSAVPPKPFGIWEYNTSTDPANGQTQLAGTTFLTYVQTFMANRLAAGKTNADILYFDVNQPNFLGNGTSQNAGFEGGTGAWAAYPATGNCAVAASAAQANTGGTGSLRMTSTASGAMIAYCALGTTLGMPVVAGTSPVGVQAWFRAAATARTCQVNILWYTAAGALLSTTAGTPVTNTTSGWTQITKAGVTAPATAAFALPQVQVNGAAAGSEVHYVDDVNLFITTNPGVAQSTVIDFPWDYRIASWQSLFTALNAAPPAGNNAAGSAGTVAATSTVPVPAITVGGSANVAATIVTATAAVGTPNLTWGLSGAAASTAATSGTFGWQAAIAGAAATVTVTAGQFTQVMTAGGAAATVTAATGGFTQAMTLTGSAAAAATTSGTLTQVMVLAGTAAPVSVTGGKLAWSAVLAGTAAGTAATSGAFTWTAALTGAAATGTATAGALTWAAALSGASAATAVTSGALGWTMVLAGTSGSAPATTGALAWSAAITGTAASASTATGALTWQAPITGTATATPATTGTFGWTAVLTGTAAAVTATAGVLGWTAALAGTAVTASTTTGVLSGTAALTGAAATTTATTGTLKWQAALTGTAATATATTGGFTWTAALAGGAASASTATGAIGSVVITGTAATATATIGGFTQVMTVAGAATVLPATTGALAWSAPIGGTAVSVTGTTGALAWSAAITGTAATATATIGGFTWTAALTGAAATGTVTAGALTWRAALTGTAATATATTGALAWAAAITGTAATGTGTTGTLAWTAPITGTAVTAAATSGAFTWTAALTGAAATGTATTGGALTWQAALTGASASTAATTGTLAWSAALAGTGTTGTATTGTLAWSAAITGAAAATTATTGALTWLAPITGTAVTAAATIGALAWSAPISGTSTSTTAATGTLAWSAPITGGATSTTGTTGALTRQAILTGTATTTTTATSGTFTWTAALTGTATTATATTATFTARMVINGTAVNVTVTTATLTARSTLAGTAVTVTVTTGSTTVTFLVIAAGGIVPQLRAGIIAPKLTAGQVSV